MRVTRSLSATLRRDGVDNSGLIANEEELLSPQPAIANEDSNRPGTSSRKKRVKVGNHLTQHFLFISPPHQRNTIPSQSLDTFRGLSIVIMIFVNYGGGSYWFFAHSPWNGLTVADLVFPWFLWIMGVSLAISIRSQLRNSMSRSVNLKIILTRTRTGVQLFILIILISKLIIYTSKFFISERESSYKFFVVLLSFLSLVWLSTVTAPMTSEPYGYRECYSASP